MALINIRNLHKSFGNKTLFEDTSLTINPLERTGIVGVNGSGKTTLLKMMVGLEEVDSGSIESNKQARIEYLAQNPDMDETMTVLDYLFQGESPTMQLLRDYETMVLALAENPADERNQSRLTQINQRMDQDNGWAAEAHAKGVLSRLGLTDFGAKIGTLSGGQRRRAAMARVLIDPADLLILDEPTNHIDPDTIVWLEDLLANLKTGLLLVTHDRYFLDRVVNHIVEVDGGNLYKHAGNYSRFLENKAEREALTQKMSVDRRNLLKREIEWLNRSPMARGSKQKARIQRAEALQAQRINTHSNSVDINVATQRTGKQIMEIKGVSKSFAGQPVVKDFSYVVNHRARLGIIGPNGEGKSTLLNMIAGRLQPDAGEIEIGATVKIGYYDQESVQLDESKRIIDYISEIAEVVHTAKGDKVSAAQMLTRFMFSHAMQYEYISTLSGGERRRLYLLQTLMMAPNFLLLDEPTNDLDVQTLSILEDFLESFDGVLITVSHDRYFLDRTVEHIFAFEGQGLVKQYPGNYSAYHLRKQALEEAKKNETTKQPSIQSQKGKPKTTRPRKLSYNEKRELETLEEKITEMEAEQEDLTTQVNAIGDDYQRLQILSDQLNKLEADLEIAMDRWVVLSEIEAE